ncbi:MAG: PIN domain-containing protein [Spirochaetales bacterium]|nr:PIN domain-containing protein [Leptospiraceae bacterium]MCP5483059.1 PIN domain-containing protein [Spirochaetales bacterium]MCP5486133.1 PIN domain-containing protein [Spirochaetales bacterium]
MILVDTSVWVEFFRRKEPVFTQLRELIEAGQIRVHALVFGELLQGCRSTAEADFVTAYWETLQDPQSNQGIVEGGRLAFEKKFGAKGIGLVDAVLLAEARRRQLRVWTLDKKLAAVLHKSERVM